MIRSGLGATAFVVLTAVCRPALADAQQCSQIAEDGQQLRARGRFVVAHERFLACSSATCPSIIRTDCARWASEVLDATPTIVIDARDASGKDLTHVKVMVDDG